MSRRRVPRAELRARLEAAERLGALTYQHASAGRVELRLRDRHGTGVSRILPMGHELAAILDGIEAGAWARGERADARRRELETLALDCQAMVRELGGKPPTL